MQKRERTHAQERKREDGADRHVVVPRQTGLAAAMKRVCTDREGTAIPDSKKRRVAYSTYSKWKAEMDKNCQTMTWLECDSEVFSSKRFVTKLRCSV